MRRAIAFVAGLALAASGFALTAVPAGASGTSGDGPTPASTAVVVNPCPPAAPGHYTCLLRVLHPKRDVTPETSGNHPTTTTLPFTVWHTRPLTPTDITKAYGYTKTNVATGTGETIGIVDAFNDPKIATDLSVFSTKFGLPACTVSNGCFKKVNQTGTTSNLPATNAGWDGEISLDVEWAHAIAPKAHILLVEASTTGTGLFTATSYAAAHAQYVSMSWGGPEQSSETTTDSSVFTPHASTVSFFASAGDTGPQVIYPAASPDVIAVGGTQLTVTLTTGAWESEKPWNTTNASRTTTFGSGGGGCSQYETATAAQASFPTYDQSGANCNGKRAIPDVAADASPKTGVYVYDSVATTTGYKGWFQVGGTSLASPLWAAHSAAAALHVTATYVYSRNIPYYDVTTGDTAETFTNRDPYATTLSCLTGYDLCTGLGSWNHTHGALYALHPAKPSPPTVVPGTSQVAVTWTKPTTEGSTITGYTVTASPGGRTCTSTAALTCTVTGLTNGDAYTFKVKAHNSDGTSPTSTASSLATPTLPLSAPATVHTTAHSVSVVVSWSAVVTASGYSVYEGTHSGGESATPISGCAGITATTCTATGLVPGTRYYFTVKTLHADVLSTSPSTEVSTEPVDAPVVTSEQPGTGSVTIDYVAHTGSITPSTYSVYEGTTSGGENYASAVSGCAGIASTTCTVTGLTTAHTYYFTVKGFGSEGSTHFSTTPSTEVTATPNTALAAPSTVHAEAASTKATVSWTTVATATRYDVYESATTGGENYSGSAACTGTGESATSCTVTGLSPGNKYYFTVETTHTGVRSAPSSQTTAVTVAAPTDVTAVSHTGTVKVHYAPGTGATITGYDVYESTSSGGENYTTPVGECAATTSQTCTLSGLTNGQAYYFTVKALGATFVTTPSTQVTATPVAVPGSVDATAGAGKVKVSWASAAGATSYKVYDATAPTGENFAGSPACTTTELSCTVTGLTPGTKYYFKLEGVNSSGTSTHSVEITATPTSGTSGGGGGGTSGGGGSMTPAPTPPKAPTGTSAAKSGSSNTPKGTAKVTDGPAGVTAVAYGFGSLTVAKYTGTPSTTTPIPTGTGNYVDVRIAKGSKFSSLTLTVCGGTGTGGLDWWNGSVWLPFSNQVTGSTGCVTVTVTATTSPRLTQLTGTQIATVKRGVTATRIYGETADATAAKELETEFRATGTTGSCVGGKADSANTRPVIIATTKTFPDALAASYFASSLDTGILLTPPTKLSGATAAALKKEGVTHVIVVGGSLAVANAVVSALEASPAYACGGGSALSEDITVTRIGGATQYDTAEMIAESVAKSFVGSVSIPGAYAGSDATGGTGSYNDTAGHGSAAPASGLLRTAILANGTEYQDAMSASGTAYAIKAPVLLTAPTALSAQAADAIAALTIRQVIVMGGPFAVSNAVVSQLGTLGVAVVRVAGKDATDTAAELAKFEVAASGTGLGWTPKVSLAVARANGFTDGLAGSVVTGKTELPLLLVENPTTVGSYLTAFLTAGGQSGSGIDGQPANKVLALVVLGGGFAITTSVVAAMEKALG